MMNTYTTFINGEFAGYKTMKELNELENQARELAVAKQRNTNADHVIYRYNSYNPKTDELDTARFYSGYELTDAEFDERTTISHSLVKAIHAR